MRLQRSFSGQRPGWLGGFLLIALLGSSVFSESAAAEAARTIAHQMLEERGRGAVLMGVARVDAAPQPLLHALMAPPTDSRDGLSLPDRPLGSLGAKVALARLLGLIDPAVERALSLGKLRHALAL